MSTWTPGGTDLILMLKGKRSLWPQSHHINVNVISHLREFLWIWHNHPHKVKGEWIGFCWSEVKVTATLYLFDSHQCFYIRHKCSLDLKLHRLRSRCIHPQCSNSSFSSGFEPELKLHLLFYLHFCNSSLASLSCCCLTLGLSRQSLFTIFL